MSTEALTKVMIVEDMSWDAELMSQALARDGMECTTLRVETEPDFREALGHFEPDIILADYSLPRFSGMRAHRIVEELRLDIPMILVSGDVPEDTALESLRVGFADYLLKDNLLRLGPAVRAALESHRMRQASHDARRQSDALSQIVDDSRNEIYIFSSSTLEFRYANRAAFTNLGYSHEELYSLTPVYLKPVTQVEFEALLEPLRLGAMEIVTFRSTHRRKDGTTYAVDIHVQRTEYMGEDAFVAIMYDVEEHDKVESDRALLEAAIEQSSNLVCITDRQGTIEYVNPAFETITGYTAEEVIGKNPRMLKSGKLTRAFYEEMWAELNAGRSWTRDFVNRRKDGTDFHQRSTIFPIHDTEGSISNYVSIAEDVSNERALEDQLRQAQKMEAMGQLTGGIAHDFNNVLAAILTNAQLLAMTLPADMKEEMEELRDIETAARRGADLVKKLMAFSRDEHLDLETVDPSEILEETVGLLERLLPANIDLTLSTDHGNWLVNVDHTGIQQILLNLATNARDAMPDGGTLAISTHADEAGTKPTIRFVVRDTGIGMEPDTLEHAFEPFFTTKDAGEGTGLGLANVHALVRRHDGTVDVASQPHVGTTFTISLPAVDPELMVPKPQAAAPSESVIRARGNLLLVEDEDPLRRAAQRALERAGHHVLVAENGRRALELLQAHRGDISLVVTDLIMPEMGGAELYEATREWEDRPAFLVMTGYGPRDVAASILDDEVPVLRKPWGVEDLLDAVSEALEGSEEAVLVSA